MSRPTKRPNIVLIISDDHGREALGCYGNPVVKTPHLDALAAEGIRFSHSFCTTASCAPSRSVVLTGLHNHTNGTFGLTHSPHNFSIANGIKTLPIYLGEAGYRTGRIGKQHYRPESQFPFDWDPEETSKAISSYDLQEVHGDDDDDAYRRVRDDVLKADQCVDFINQDDDRPFFLYFASYNPHRENLRPDHPLKPDDFGNPTEDFPGDKELKFNPDDVIVPNFLTDTPETRAELAEYYQSINRLDRGIGRLIKHLGDAGVMDNTVIMYLTDNGSAFPVSKTTLYEPSMRLPFIIRSPLHKGRGVVNDAMVNWADITPTIMDLAGKPLEKAEEFLGESILPILDDPDAKDWRDEVFAAHSFHQVTNYYPMRVIRTQKFKFFYNIAWKLTYPSASDLWRSGSLQSAMRKGDTIGKRTFDSYLNRPMFELYDLDEDPDELDNLAADPEYAEMVEDFIERIKVYQKATKDPWFHKWEYE